MWENGHEFRFYKYHDSVSQSLTKTVYELCMVVRVSIKHTWLQEKKATVQHAVDVFEVTQFLFLMHKFSKAQHKIRATY